MLNFWQGVYLLCITLFIVNKNIFVHKNIYVQSFFRANPPVLTKSPTLILTLALKGWYRLRVDVKGKGKLRGQGLG